MRIPAKVSLGVGGLALLVFGSLAAWQARTEHHELMRATEEEMMLTGRAMRIASENALRDRQIDDVDMTVSALEAIRADVDVLLFAPDGTLRAASHGASVQSLDLAALDRLVGERPHLDLASDRATLVVPLVAGEQRLGSLAIVRPLSDVRGDLEREIATLVLAVLGFTALVSALAYGLGEVVVGRPLARLSAAMARVPAGEFHPQLDTQRADEIGRVTSAFLGMLAELELARRNLETEQDAHRRSTRALQDADRLVTIGQLSAGLAHEIGSPLLVLHGRARRLLRQAEDPEEVRRGAELIAGQAERITRIVEQLLDVARRRVGQTRSDPVVAVRTVVDLLEVEARHKRVTLLLDVADARRLGTVEADAMQQIALNLTRNALQAAGEGGRVRLHLGSATFTRPGTSEPTASVRLVVEDDGAGVDPQLREQLFEPFFTTRAADGGTGLGLAIVGTLVHELGGCVTVASEMGAGSRFTVDLPMAEGAADSARSEVA